MACGWWTPLLAAAPPDVEGSDGRALRGWGREGPWIQGWGGDRRGLVHVFRVSLDPDPGVQCVRAARNFVFPFRRVRVHPSCPVRNLHTFWCPLSSAKFQMEMGAWVLRKPNTHRTQPRFGPLRILVTLHQGGVESSRFVRYSTSRCVAFPPASPSRELFRNSSAKQVAPPGWSRV